MAVGDWGFGGVGGCATNHARVASCGNFGGGTRAAVDVDICKSGGSRCFLLRNGLRFV